ncbi:hypothetical protein ACFL2B_00665 [Patescibacteria group bacterium]
MKKEEIVKSLTENEREMLDLLSQIVDIVGLIYEEQANHEYRGANLYPPDMTEKEFADAAAERPWLKSFDMVIERSDSGKLVVIPYCEKYRQYFEKIIPQLEKVKALTVDNMFRTYIDSLLVCLQRANRLDYWQMMGHWVETRDYQINFPFTYDELYLDRLMGIKGGFNAALLLEDKEMSAEIQRPLGIVDGFISWLDLPAGAEHFTNLQIGIYHTVNNQGLMADMGLRAWNLPNDFKVRAEHGGRQMLLSEMITGLAENQVQCIARDILFNATNIFNPRELQWGYMMAVAFHELSHNIGLYQQANNLDDLHCAYEEFRADVVALLWIHYCAEQGIFIRREAQVASLMLLANEILDIGCAKTMPSRICFKEVAVMKFRYLHLKGALYYANSKLEVNFGRLLPASKDLLREVVRISISGDYKKAKYFRDLHFQPKIFQNLIIKAEEIME